MKNDNSFKYQSLAIVIFVASNVVEEGFYIQADFTGQIIGLIGIPLTLINLPLFGLLFKKSWTYHRTMRKSSIFWSALFGLILLLTLAGFD